MARRNDLMNGREVVDPGSPQNASRCVCSRARTILFDSFGKFSFDVARVGFETTVFEGGLFTDCKGFSYGLNRRQSAGLVFPKSDTPFTL
eukprot:5290493-Lingulodinium_polyedra.AAC.1